LSQVPPAALVTLTSDELAEGTSVWHERRLVRRSGWPETEGALLALPSDSAWHCAVTKSLVIVDLEPEIHREFKAAFAGIPRVYVARGDIFTVVPDCPADAYMSSANTIGNMDGGIDRAFADKFGWSYGRPFCEPNPLQLAIDEVKGRGHPLSLGEAITVRDGRHCLIAAVSMEDPNYPIPPGSVVIRDACKAGFARWRADPAISVLRCQAFGTNYGKVPPSVAARQMLEGLIHAWSPSSTQ